MPFNSSLPTWNKTATAPTTTKQNAGWSAGEKPPASIFDWFFNTTFLALQELQQEAINTDQKGVNNGVATLDATGDLPIGQADNILNWVKGFGLGDVIKQIIGGDANTIDQTGFYYIDGTSTNGPIASTGFYIINLKFSTASAYQMAFHSGTQKMYFRRKSTTWGTWIEVAQYDATGKIAISNLPAATTALAGIAQLSDSITDTSTTKAATANSVKMAIDWAKGFGLGDVAKDISSTDLNNLDASGFYRGTTMTNAPSAGPYFVINIKGSNSTFRKQIALSYAGEDTYTRTINGGSWSAWVRSATYDTNGKVAIANLPAASTSAVGVVQLNDTLTSTSTTQAATANAVKQITDKAQMVKLVEDDGTTFNSVSFDLNTTYDSGFYYYSGASSTNGAIQQNATVEVYKFSSNSSVQVFTLMNSVTPRRWIRYGTGGTWGAWVEVAQLDANSKIPVANLPYVSTTSNGILTSTDKTKLDGIADNANNYVHPANHSPSIITQDANNRFVTDAEKATWNGKASTSTATTGANGLMSSADKTKLDGIATGAEVNQNAFSTVNANGVSVTADIKSDTLGIFQGKGITVSGTPASNSLTISNDLVTSDGILNVPNQSYVHLNSTGTQSIASQTDTKITILTSEIYDNQNEAASSRFTAKEAGNYLVRMFIDWGASNIPAAEDSLKVYKNGIYYAVITADSAARYLDGLLPLKLNAGDYIEFYVYQSSGSTAKVLQSANAMVAKLS